MRIGQKLIPKPNTALRNRAVEFRMCEEVIQGDMEGVARDVTSHLICYCILRYGALCYTELC